MKTKQLIVLIILLIIIVCLSIVFVIYTENKNQINQPRPVLPNINIIEDNAPTDNNFTPPNLDKNFNQAEVYCGDSICEIGEELTCPQDCNAPPLDNGTSPNTNESDYCGDGKCSKSESSLGNCDSDCK